MPPLGIIILPVFREAKDFKVIKILRTYDGIINQLVIFRKKIFQIYPYHCFRKILQ